MPPLFFFPVNQSFPYYELISSDSESVISVNQLMYHISKSLKLVKCNKITDIDRSAAPISQ